MRSIVYILCDRVSDLELEKAVKERSALIAGLTRRGLLVDAGVQADTENQVRSRTTYAEIARSCKIQGDGRKFLDRFKSYSGSQVSYNH